VSPKTSKPELQSYSELSEAVSVHTPILRVHPIHQGVPLIRKRVAEFIENRDGFPADPEDIFLTAGASIGVQSILMTTIENENSGIMIPIPQYPLYTASIDMYGGKAVPYYLDESREWGLAHDELKRSINEANKAGVDVKALCVINPGNPTGQCLSEESMREIVEFCKEEKIALLADEVYQANVYASGRPFVSFKKVLRRYTNLTQHGTGI
jgi:aspartate/methionine/tyrosine aminotransferase